MTKPGVSIRVPPIRISAPSASSRAGIRPVCSAVAQRLPGAAALAPDQPGAEDAVDDEQQDRPPGPDHLADLDEHVDLDQRHDDEGAPTAARPAGDRRRVIVGRPPARRRVAHSWSAPLAQPPGGDPAQRLAGHRAAHLGVAAHPLDELDRHLADDAARPAACGRPGRSGRRSRWTARCRGRSSPAPRAGRAGSRPSRRGRRCRAAAGRRGCRRARAASRRSGQLTTEPPGTQREPITRSASRSASSSRCSCSGWWEPSASISPITS